LAANNQGIERVKAISAFESLFLSNKRLNGAAWVRCLASKKNNSKQATEFRLSIYVNKMTLIAANRLTAQVAGLTFRGR